MVTRNWAFGSRALIRRSGAVYLYIDLVIPGLYCMYWCYRIDVLYRNPYQSVLSNHGPQSSWLLLFQLRQLRSCAGLRVFLFSFYLVVCMATADSMCLIHHIECYPHVLAAG